MQTYMGSHRPASPEYGAPLHDVSSMMPDFYELPLLYSHSTREIDGPSMRAVLKAKGNIESVIRVWRAIPKDAEDCINAGDWVTTSGPYAQQEGESIPGGSRVITRRVRAGDLWTEGNSVNEWGYWPMCSGCTNTNRETEACPNYGITNGWLCLDCCKACCT